MNNRRSSPQPTNANQLLMQAGMSSSPEFYSGRGATRSDLSVPELMSIYKGIKSGQRSGAFPESAGGAFLQMVADIKLLAATPFIRNLKALEYRGWEPLEKTNDDEMFIGKDADGNHDVFGGMGGLFAALGRSEDDRKRELALSESWKHQFLAQLQNPGLLKRLMRGRPSPDLYNTGYGYEGFNPYDDRFGGEFDER